MKNFDKVQQHWVNKRKDYLKSVLVVAENFFKEHHIIQLWNDIAKNDLQTGFAFILEESVKDLFYNIQSGIIDLEDLITEENDPQDGDIDHFISDLRWNLIQEIEEILAENDCRIPDSLRANYGKDVDDEQEDDSEEACIYGDTFYGLEDEFTNEAWSIIRSFVEIVKGN